MHPLFKGWPCAYQTSGIRDSPCLNVCTWQVSTPPSSELKLASQTFVLKDSVLRNTVYSTFKGTTVRCQRCNIATNHRLPFCTTKEEPNTLRLFGKVFEHYGSWLVNPGGNKGVATRATTVGNLTCRPYLGDSQLQLQLHDRRCCPR